MLNTRNKAQQQMVHEEHENKHNTAQRAEEEDFKSTKCKQCSTQQQDVPSSLDVT